MAVKEAHINWPLYVGVLVANAKLKLVVEIYIENLFERTEGSMRDQALLKNGRHMICVSACLPAVELVSAYKFTSRRSVKFFLLFA